MMRKLTFGRLWAAAMGCWLAGVAIDGLQPERVLPESPVALAFLVLSGVLLLSSAVVNHRAGRPAREAKRREMVRRRAYLESFDRGAR